MRLSNSDPHKPWFPYFSPIAHNPPINLIHLGKPTIPINADKIRTESPQCNTMYHAPVLSSNHIAGLQSLNKIMRRPQYWHHRILKLPIWASISPAHQTPHHRRDLQPTGSIPASNARLTNNTHAHPPAIPAAPQMPPIHPDLHRQLRKIIGPTGHLTCILKTPDTPETSALHNSPCQPPKCH